MYSGDSRNKRKLIKQKLKKKKKQEKKEIDLAKLLAAHRQLQQ